MRKLRRPMALGLFVLMLVSFFPALTGPVLAADPVIKSVYIERTDNEIDQMVYELYGLNDEEILIIEKSLEK